MKKFFNAIIVLIAFHSNEIISQDIEEVVITSSYVNTTEITNPLYVIDGEEILRVLVMTTKNTKFIYLVQ